MSNLLKVLNDTDHYLTVTKVRKKLSKQETQTFDLERFNLREKR
jgi:hypothetical protein